jgi:hypothetical protein
MSIETDLLKKIGNEKISYHDIKAPEKLNEYCI